MKNHRTISYIDIVTFKVYCLDNRKDNRKEKCCAGSGPDVKNGNSDGLLPRAPIILALSLAFRIRAFFFYIDTHSIVL